MPPDLRTAIGAIELSNPVICGAGEHVASREGLLAAIDAGAGAVVAKSANETDAGRRQWETRAWTLIGDDRRAIPVESPAPGSSSLMNRSGLVPTPWAEWLETLAAADAYAAERGAYVVASLIPGDTERLAGLAADAQAAGIRWLELNLSAPHASEAIDPDSIESTAAAERAAELTARVRAAFGASLTVKLSAEGSDLVATAAAVREAGADSVAIFGRHLGFLPDLATRRPMLGSFGAISGPWALPLALRWLAKTRGQLGSDLPLIGSNGARSGGDVARFLLAGASAVQVATSVIVEGFSALARFISELDRYLEESGMDASEIVGEAADAVLPYEEAAMRSKAG
jgi:dihydroorotate dehydrogenase (NAD+) catalytic subunit